MPDARAGAREVVLCSLGGTVQFAPGEDGGALPSLDARGLVADASSVPAGVRVTVVPLAQVPSAALDLADLYRVVETVGPMVTAGAAGVVVSMGTDMLEEAAFALDLLWNRPGPLVVTAAMRTPGSPGADGPANLRAAVQVAADPQARRLGCLVVLNDDVHAAWQVQKTHTGSPSAFRSVQSGPLGGVVEGRLRLVASPVDRPWVDLPANPDVPPVALLRACLGDDGRLLHGLVDAGFGGLVVETAGGGSVPPAWAAPLGAVARLVPVVYASRTARGPTLLGTYGGPGAERDLAARGVLPAGVLDGLKARVLLRLLLAAGAGPAGIRACFRAFDQPTRTGTRCPEVGSHPPMYARRSSMTAPSTSSTTASDALIGPQTRRALDNFPGHGRRFADVPEFVRAYAMVKAATAMANRDLEVLDADRADAIVVAATEAADGHLNTHFPTALVQGGGGTSTNMNINEVLAARATQLLAGRGSDLVVHPNDHVNRSQSTNDSYPTAMALALRDLAAPAITALDQLVRSVTGKAEQYDRTPRLGRTCLQDAVPLTVGQTHRAHAAALRRSREGLEAAVACLAAVPLGATAVGTGIGAPPGFAAVAVGHLSGLSGHELTVTEDFFDALAHLDPYSALAAACVRAAVTMSKIAADLRLLSSGPAGGLGEVTLPALQAGSSIMPGKVNPVIPELVMQLGYRIRGAAATVDIAVAAGELELNIMEPVILDALVTVLRDLTAAAEFFAGKCVDDLEWNHRALGRNLRGSLHEFVDLAAGRGYEAATRTLRAQRFGRDQAG